MSGPRLPTLPNASLTLTNVSLTLICAKSALWERNYSPFALLRNLHFLGPLLVGKYSSRRFGSLPDEDLRPLHAYCAGIFTAKGSSEYCCEYKRLQAFDERSICFG